MAAVRPSGPSWPPMMGESVAERMSGAEFAAHRHLVGLTLDELATTLGVNPRTARAWETGRDPISLWVRPELAQLVVEHGRLATSLATDGRPVMIVRDKSAGDAPRPRGWYVAAAARALVMEPDLEVEWLH